MTGTAIGVPTRILARVVALSACWTLALNAGQIGEVRGQEGATQLPVEAPGSNEAPASDGVLLERAVQIRALMRGTLDPSIEPRTLFEVTLQPKAEPDLRSVLQHVAPSTGQVPVDNSKTAARQLLDVQAEFLSLPSKRRRQILAKHQARQRAADQSTRVRAEKEQHLAKLDEQVAGLTALLNGEAVQGVGLDELLSVNLLDDLSLATNATRREAFLALVDQGDVGSETKETSIPDAETPIQDAEAPIPEADPAQVLDARLDHAQRALDVLRARFLALPLPEREKLLASAREASQPVEGIAAESASADAEKAAQDAVQIAEKKQALEVAKASGSEVSRLAAEEKLRLLSIKEAQTQFAAALTAQRKTLEQDRDEALRWDREVRDLGDGSMFDLTKTTEADEMYSRLVEDLTAMRSKLRDTLAEVLGSNTEIPSPQSSEALPLPKGVDDSEIRALSAELTKNHRRLEQLDTALVWDTALGQRDAMVSMNQNRLRLLKTLSAEKRAALKGFGPTGLAQVKREVEQITLEARYHLLALPRFVSQQVDATSRSPWGIGTALFKLILVLLVFFGWRRNADRIIEDLRRSWRRKRPQTDPTRWVVSALWYLKRVRSPLEWLILVVILQRVFLAFRELPELEYLWLIALWVLLGSFVIHLLNAIAQRQGRGTKESAELRFGSLRLVGVTVVSLGLLLALTNATVGRGAIYAWVTTGAWALFVPVALILVAWWRPIVVSRAEAHGSPGRTLKWVAARKEGLGSFMAGAVGGVYLLIEGLYGFALRQVSQLTLTRRVFSYLFRRQVERQTSLSPDASSYSPLDPAVYEALSPEHPTDVRIGSIMEEQIKFIRHLVREDNNAVVAVTGQRGMGKTTFIKHVVEGLSEKGCWKVQCRTGGISSLLADLAVCAGLPATATEEEVAKQISEQRPTVVCVDDAHRIIRPIIGGLSDIDRFIDLAHKASPTTSWLVAVGLPAWQYLRRARGDRAIFDEVVELDPWAEEDLASLIRLRNDEVSIRPSFKGLNVPRQVDTDVRISEEERTEKDFHRILWDYSEGNPGVALHFWRESLSAGMREGQPRVRLYKAPSAADFDEVQSTMHFVLRAIVQIDLATEKDIFQATNLRSEEVADALRLAGLRGYIAIQDEGIRVELAWYRAIVQLLRRHHLITI